MDPKNSNLPSNTTDVEEKSNNAHSRKPSVKSYAARVFQESTVGIVSSIFTTHSKYRRVFKVFLSSLCIAGFIYHCVAFLNHVLGYPEVVNIYSNRSRTYNWPAYTYCNNNPSFKYTTEVTVQEYVDGVGLREQHSYIDVEIYLSNDGVKVLRHSPKYEAVDVISSIGGFMGCWLGIALMDILDVFGSIISVCGYAFRKKLPKKIKRRQST